LSGKRQFRLSDADRARLGCPESIDALDAATLTVDEAALIQHQTPYRGPGELRQALLGVPAVDASGNPVYADQPGPDGEPVQERDPDYQAAKVAAWLAVRRAGVLLAYKDFTFGVFDFNTREQPDTEPAGGELVDAAGKGDGSTPPTTSEP